VGDSDQVLQRNKGFAATCAHEEDSIIARHQVCVITCPDPRTDPSDFLDLDLGDAMVVDNARGRVSPGVP
jgi:carbonic anhydrase